MNLTLKQIINWASKHPFFSILIFVVAVFSYGNLFYFGFRLSIPIALRPFLDTYFLSSLALEVLVCLALAALTSRLVVLISRLVLSKFPLKISKVLKQFEIFFLGLFDTSDLGASLDRFAKIQFKLIGRWVRRKNLVVTLLIGLSIFSVLFLGWHTLWYLPICVLAAPLFWMLISQVELRRYFATINNTRQMTVTRVKKAVITFSLIFCGFLAGIAHFQHRLDTLVTIQVTNGSRESSLIAVTSSGLLVGIRGTIEHMPADLFSLSAHFLPYGGVLSVGQRH